MLIVPVYLNEENENKNKYRGLGPSLPRIFNMTIEKSVDFAMEFVDESCYVDIYDVLCSMKEYPNIKTDIEDNGNFLIILRMDDCSSFYSMNDFRAIKSVSLNNVVHRAKNLSGETLIYQLKQRVCYGPYCAIRE